MLVVVGLWGLFVALTALGTVSNAIPFFRSLTEDTGPYGFSLTGPLAGPFALDLFALLAALFLGLVVVRNPRGWGNGKRFALGGLAFTMMVGRLAGGGVFGLAMTYVAVPPWLAVLGAPIALFSGGFILLAVASLAAFGMFAVFVAFRVRRTTTMPYSADFRDGPRRQMATSLLSQSVSGKQK